MNVERAIKEIAELTQFVHLAENYIDDTFEKMNKLGHEMDPSDVTTIIKKRSKNDELYRVVRKFYRN
ncbi:hypothetical protein M3589_07865 [Heyndrickxia oleronia]|uniref:hypothetical protein n=1 Tax=Heyndrickxia oleronia TaxID=38875 RepID=UPI00204224B3|nr:hypothetical protein [Heyndrickxia oleronia]MCM3237640.1 hypothetical protein [Heyndrickxia oleronia]